MALKHLTEGNFDSEIGLGTTIVDFFADWCGPCKMMAPVFEEASKEYEGKVKFAKVNVEEERDLAIRHKILGIPALVIFQDGQEIDRIAGFVQKDAIKQKLDSVL